MNTPALLLITGTLVMAACGGDGDATSEATTATPPATTIPASTTTVVRTSTTTSTTSATTPPGGSTDAETPTTIAATTTSLTTSTTTVAPTSTSAPTTAARPPASAPATSTTIADSNCAIAVEVVAGTSGTTRQVDIRVESQRRNDYVNVELVWADMRVRLALYISPAGIGTTRVDAPGTEPVVARVYDTSAFQPSGVRCRT
jgi:hypothetical protein